jgi:hypothetical protein
MKNLVFESLDELYESKKVPTTKKGKQKKFKKTMGEWKQGELNIGKSDKKVSKSKKGQKQAVAIALSQTGQSNK